MSYDRSGVEEPSAEECLRGVSARTASTSRPKALVDFMVNLDSRINLFKHYNTECVFEVMFLATLPGNQKRRIGELLVSSSIELAKELKRGKAVKTPVAINGDNAIENLAAVPNLVCAIMTSNYSQKIAAKCGFESLIRVNLRRVLLWWKNLQREDRGGAPELSSGGQEADLINGTLCVEFLTS